MTRNRWFVLAAIILATLALACGSGDDDDDDDNDDDGMRQSAVITLV